MNETSSVMTSFVDHVQDTNKDVTHSVVYNSKAFAADDYIVSELYGTPLGTTTYNVGGDINMGNINTCDTTIYKYCIGMNDIKWIIWKIKTPIAAGIS